MIPKYDDQFVTKLKENNDEFSYYSNKCNDYYLGLMSKMFHELNNPITLIKSTIQLIETKYPKISDIDYWPQLSRDVEDYLELLASFRIWKDCLNVLVSNNNLLSSITSVVNSFYPISDQKDIDLKLSITDDAKPYFLNYPFDKVRLKQAFTNLLKNSVEAAKPGGFIHVECSLCNKNLIVAFHNSGDPISKEDQLKIFKQNVTSKPTGTGLGLPISKSIILSHMGDIDIVSTDEKTSVIITLPIH